MNSAYTEIWKAASAIRSFCQSPGVTYTRLEVSAGRLDLPTPPDEWLYGDTDEAHTALPYQVRTAIRNAVNDLHQRTLEAHCSTVSSMLSVQHLGGEADDQVQAKVAAAFAKKYQEGLTQLRAMARDWTGKRLASTKSSLVLLEEAYTRSSHLTAREVALVSQLSRLSEAQVRVWFQNRRARARKIAEKEKRQQEEEARQDVDSPEAAVERRPVAALPKRGGKKGALQPKASTSAPLQDSADTPAADKPRAVKGLPKRGKKDAPTKPAVTTPSQVPRPEKSQQRSLAPARSLSASSDWSATSASSLDSASHPASSTAVSHMIPSVASSETAVSSNEAQAMMGPGWNGPMISIPMPNGETPSFNFVPPTPAKADFTPWALPEDFATAYGTGVDLSSFGMPGFDGSHVGQMMQDAAWQETSLEDMFAMLNEYTPQDSFAFESALALGASPFYSNASSTLSPDDHSQASASPATTTSEDQAEDALVHQLIAKWASEPYHLDPPSGPQSISSPSCPGGSTSNSRPASFMENAFLPLDFSSFAGPSTDIGEISSEWSVEIPPPNAEGDALLREADEWLRFSPSPSPQPQQLPDSSHSGSPASSMPHTPNSRHAGLMDINMPGLVIQDGMGVIDPRYVPLPASPKMGPKDVVGEWVAGVLPFDLHENDGWSLEPVAWTPLQ